MDEYSIIGTRIREQRTLKRLSQEELGNILAVSQDTISLWENSKSLPPCEMIIALSKFFEIPSDYLLGLSDY
ncbi:MAG: helix-turn-helix domain-containing protein [Clostridia bacterium]|nr:helix-turn-helix domain-containing protein [Clostridia bacterium]MDE7328270.1 helix-turn-helix domain-containing protein [Clostridia bacterium]